MWSKAARRLKVATAVGWGIVILLLLARQIVGHRIVTPMHYATLLTAVGVVTVLYGLMATLHGRVYQLGYLSGTADERGRHEKEAPNDQ